MMHRHSWVLVGCLAGFGLSCGPQTAAPPAAEPAAKATPAATTAAVQPKNPCPGPKDAPCGDNCSNVPYEESYCWTTDYGPARANVVLGNPLDSPNMLYCAPGGSYALCYFSGPPEQSTKGGGTAKLPCVVGPDGLVSCTCQAYTGSAYFVDINAIGNANAYYATIQQCGPNGSLCQNMHNCGTDGTKAGCSDHQPAPVCAWVNGQNRDNPATSLVPGADLISTFSLAMNNEFQIGSKPCSNATYAGCMTAPCKFVDGPKTPPFNGETIQCQCPTWNGPYQVGQNNASCTATPEGSAVQFVWSAAYAVPVNAGG